MDRELLYVFGTGNATVTNLYNTCFALRDSDEYFMVDAGGGNQILKILDNMQVPIERIHHLFVTHAHTDHVLGVVLDDPHDRHQNAAGRISGRRLDLLS